MGLREFDETDPLFVKALAPRVMLTGVFTLGWYTLAKQARFFGSNSLLNRSAALVVIPAFLLSKGMACHYVAVQDGLHSKQVAREKELNNYRREVRRNLNH